MLRIYNTLSRQKENCIPFSNKRIHLYVCGITPYDTTHVGHAFTYISFDILARFLSYSGYLVTYTQNVTDINDRDNDILKRAQQQHIPWNQLATYWTDKFLTDMKTLNWIMPTHYLYASQQIPSVIDCIEKILANGFGYEINGSVYLDKTKKHDFGKLSRLTPEHMLDIAKKFEEDLKNPDKKHPLDITLWRAHSGQQPEHIPSFESPWGKGRPGWHIECSAMAIHSLGEHIDIHGGGRDLIYPHHESEIAQSEAATGKIPFAKYWMHTGIVYIAGKKMSKSQGNLILISDLLKKYSANALRWILLSHHYREDWNYDEKECIKAEKTINEIKKFLQETPYKTEKKYFKKKSVQYLENDLDTPGLLHEIMTTMKENENNQYSQSELKEILTLLGFIF